MNIQEFFSPNYEFYLDNIVYTHKQKTSKNTAYTLNCNDSINAQYINDEKLKVTVTRSLKFSPDDLYSLSVSFVAVLQVLQENKQDLLEIKDLPQKLVEDGQFFLPDLVSRMSTLISNITASYGQPPVVTPPFLAPMSR